MLTSARMLHKILRVQGPGFMVSSGEKTERGSYTLLFWVHTTLGGKHPSFFGFAFIFLDVYALIIKIPIP
jgi:hypothetical protein